VDAAFRCPPGAFLLGATIVVHNLGCPVVLGQSMVLGGAFRLELFFILFAGVLPSEIVRGPCLATSQLQIIPLKIDGHGV
jgi:hypothetical protein